MGNSTSRHTSVKNNTERVGIASHPYQQQHPYNLDDDESIFTENYEDYVDELLEPRQLKHIFSSEESKSSKTRSCRQKQGSRRAGEVFEPVIQHYSHRMSSSSKNNYDRLGGHSDDEHSYQNQLQSMNRKKASKNSILKALQQKLTATQTDFGNRNILTKASTDSEESNGSELSFREFVKLSAKNDDNSQSHDFHTYGKQLSTIMDVSEYSNTNFNDTTFNDDSYFLSDLEKTCFTLEHQSNDSILSDASSEKFIDPDMTDYAERMNSFIDKNHASYDNEDVESMAEVKTSSEKCGKLFADMALDQSGKCIVMDDAQSDEVNHVGHDHDESTNGTWDEFDESSSKYCREIGSKKKDKINKTDFNRDSSVEQSIKQERYCFDEELSSIESSAFDSEITSVKNSTTELSEELSGCSPPNKFSTTNKQREPSPVPIYKPMKAPTTSNLVNLLPSMSNNDEDSETVSIQKIANNKKQTNAVSEKEVTQGSKIGTYIDFDDDMTQVSAITTAPVLEACAVIQNHSKPALSKQAISNAMFLFSEDSVPVQKKKMFPSKIDEQRLSILNLDLHQLPHSASLQVRSLYGELTLPNEAPVDMIRRLSRESLVGKNRTINHGNRESLKSITIQKNCEYIQISNQGSIFSIPEKKIFDGIDIVDGERNISSNFISENADEISEQIMKDEEHSSVQTNNEQDHISHHDSVSESLDDDNFQTRYSAITPMKSKSPYIRFKKALRMFGGTVSRNDRSHESNLEPNMKSDDSCTNDTRLTSFNISTQSPELGSKSSPISPKESPKNDVFADLLNMSSPESSQSQMYLPVQLQSAMKKPNHVRDHSLNRVSWVFENDGNNKGISKSVASPTIDSSVADSASAISMTPPPPVASSSRTFRSVVNPRMMIQSSQVQSKVKIHETDENSLSSSYCSYSPLKSQTMNKSIEKTVPNSRSALCLSPLQKTPSQSRKWRKSVDNDQMSKFGNAGGTKRQRNATKRTPFANLRNANFV
jgi:hypothetical protein